MLNFLGTGGAFAFDLGNNSAYMKNGDELLIIDCGESTMKTVYDIDLLKGIEKVYILITHFHSDHVGSLGSFVFYCGKRDTTVIYPNTEDMKTLLGFYGVGGRAKVVSPEEFTAFPVKAYKQTHEKLEAYGYMFEYCGEKIYFSGDTKSVPSEPLELLKAGKLDYFYEDLREKENEFHLSFPEIEKLIPEEYRKKVYCMHFDKSEDIPKIQALGFNTVK